jgi:uncharacterized repeat protein (TIGR04052 family)
MSMQRWMVVGGLAMTLAVGCGDDSDDSPGDAGASGSGGGGSGGRAAGGRGGAGGRANGGSGGQGGNGGRGASDSEEITIRFKAVIGNEDFKCGKTFDDVGSKDSSVEPADFRAFVQDVALIDEDDNEVPVRLAVRAPWQSEDVGLLDFEDGTGLCSGEGNSETNLTLVGTVPKGKYKGITFANGVPEALNHADPTTLEDPLKTYASMSWGWLLGFRFSVIQLSAQSDEDGGVAGGLLHAGSTSCSNTAASDGGVDFEAPPEIDCLKPNRNKIKLSNYKVGESVIVADLAKLFEATDLSVDSSCHSGGDACPAIFERYGIDFANSDVLSTQAFYRVE